MADNVLFESGDDLDEANLLGAHAKTNQTDYVVRGLGFAVDHTAETLDTGSGAAIIETSNNEAYILETIDARTDLALATTTGTNHVFLSVDDTTDANDISITVKSTDTPPSDPSLKIGTVDASADTSTELNRDPLIAADERSITNLGGRAVLGSGQSITADTETKVQFDTVVNKDYDDRNEWDLTNHKFVPDNTGRYLICFNARQASVADGTTLQGRVKVAGTEIMHSAISTGAADSPNIDTSDVQQLDAGEDVEFFVESTTGDALIATSSDTYATVVRLA